MKNIEDILLEFNEKGLIILKNILNEKEVRIIKEKVKKIAENEKKRSLACLYSPTYDEKITGQRVWNLINKDEIFREIIVNNDILDIMEKIFDRETVHQKFYLSSFQAHIVLPGSGAQKLHIDTPVPEPLPKWPIKANSIWALNDFMELNGTTEYVEGSHKYTQKPCNGDESKYLLKKAIAPKGSVIITHGALWHRSGENRTSKSRIALLGSFAASYAREIANEEDYSKVLSSEILEGSTDTFKRIMGYGHGIKDGASY